MRVADFIAGRLKFLGLTDVYMVTGGAAMHLNDAFAKEFSGRVHCLHHEQSCAIAAESFARVTNRPAIVNVTAGPGGINAINGVFGAFVDSIPMIVVSGQAKRETLVINSGVQGLRQLGGNPRDQFWSPGSAAARRSGSRYRANGFRCLQESRNRPGSFYDL
jgi:acetolactate synthase-1/2/3 large subunit